MNAPPNISRNHQIEEETRHFVSFKKKLLPQLLTQKSLLHKWWPSPPVSMLYHNKPPHTMPGIVPQVPWKRPITTAHLQPQFHTPIDTHSFPCNWHDANNNDDSNITHSLKVWGCVDLDIYTKEKCCKKFYQKTSTLANLETYPHPLSHFFLAGPIRLLVLALTPMLTRFILPTAPIITPCPSSPQKCPTPPLQHSPQQSLRSEYHQSQHYPKSILNSYFHTITKYHWASWLLLGCPPITSSPMSRRRPVSASSSSQGEDDLVQLSSAPTGPLKEEKPQTTISTTTEPNHNNNSDTNDPSLHKVPTAVRFREATTRNNRNTGSIPPKGNTNTSKINNKKNTTPQQEGDVDLDVLDDLLLQLDPTGATVESTNPHTTNDHIEGMQTNIS